MSSHVTCLDQLQASEKVWRILTNLIIWLTLFELRIQQMTSAPFSSLVSGLIARSLTFPARNKHNFTATTHASFLLSLESGTTIHDNVNVTSGLLKNSNKTVSLKCSAFDKLRERARWTESWAVIGYPLRWSYLPWCIPQACSVKMAGYWLRSFFASLWTRLGP